MIALLVTVASKHGNWAAMFWFDYCVLHYKGILLSLCGIHFVYADLSLVQFIAWAQFKMN